MKLTLFDIRVFGTRDFKTWKKSVREAVQLLAAFYNLQYVAEGMFFIVFIV